MDDLSDALSEECTLSVELILRSRIRIPVVEKIYCGRMIPCLHFIYSNVSTVENLKLVESPSGSAQWWKDSLFQN